MKVEYETTPIAVDERHPRFSWRMVSAKGARGCRQTAYRIVVRDDKAIASSFVKGKQDSLSTYRHHTSYHWLSISCGQN